MADSQARQVRQFVETLNQEDRYIVLLYFADGLTSMEISRVLNLPSDRVQHRLQELRTELAGKLTLHPAATPRLGPIGQDADGGSHVAAYA